MTNATFYLTDIAPIQGQVVRGMAIIIFLIILGVVIATVWTNTRISKKDKSPNTKLGSNSSKKDNM